MRKLQKLVFGAGHRLAMPIAVYPGAQLVGATVRDVVTSVTAQVDAVLALQARYKMPVVQTAMDLSVEAEAFGAPVHVSESEVPTVTDAIVRSAADVDRLPRPEPGAGRTGIYLETARALRRYVPDKLVLGGCIGPFSLAGRLVGLTEVCMLAATEPALVNTVLERCTCFLTQYARAYKAAGADGIIVAEPASGLLSPDMMESLSIAWIRQIVEAVQDDSFGVILHNCGARPVHLPAKLKAGVAAYHFGAPMDMAAALAAVPSTVPVCGNLDPSRVFVHSEPGQVIEATNRLLQDTARHANFVISSGCDIPPACPIANLDAFFDAVAQFNARG